MKCFWRSASTSVFLSHPSVPKPENRCGCFVQARLQTQARPQTLVKGQAAGLVRFSRVLPGSKRRIPYARAPPAAAAAAAGQDPADPLLYTGVNGLPQQLPPAVRPAVQKLLQVPVVGVVVQSCLNTLHRFKGLWGKFLPMVTLFFLMAFVNTVLDNLKDTLVITASGGGAEVIPYLSVYAVLPLSLLFLVAYSFASQVLPRKALFNAIIGTFMAFFAVFALVLYPNHQTLHPHAYADTLQQVLPCGLAGLVGMIRNWTFTLFYCMAELWGDVGLSLLFWGLANDTTGLRDAPVLYPFFGLGANVAQTAAGKLLRAYSGTDASGSFASELQSIMMVVLVLGAAILALHAFITHQAAKASPAETLDVPRTSQSLHGTGTASSSAAVAQTQGSGSSNRGGTATGIRPPLMGNPMYERRTSSNASSGLNGHAPVAYANGNGQHRPANGYSPSQNGYSPVSNGYPQNANGRSASNPLSNGHHNSGASTSSHNGASSNGHKATRPAANGVYPLPAGYNAATTSNGYHLPAAPSNGFQSNPASPSSSEQSWQANRSASSSIHKQHNGIDTRGQAHAASASAAERSAGETSTSGASVRGGSSASTDSVKGNDKKQLSVLQIWSVLVSSIEIRCLAVMSIAQGLCSSIMEFTWKCHISALYPSPSDMTAFLGDVAVWTGVVTGTLMLLSPFLFERLGWRGVALATPQMMLLGGGAFFGLCFAFQHFYAGMTAAALTSVAGVVVLKTVVFGGAALFVLTKGAKFSLFKPAEEMIYIAMDEQGRTKGKAAIDVVGAQAGKSGGSLLQQGLLILSGGTLLGIVPVMAVVFLLMTAGWQQAVHRLADAKGMDAAGAEHGMPPAAARAEPGSPVVGGQSPGAGPVAGPAPAAQSPLTVRADAAMPANMKFWVPKGQGDEHELQHAMPSRVSANA